MSTSYKVDMDGKATMLDPDKGSMYVKMWDVGPKAPKTPAKPAVPEGKEGTPAHDLALIEFESELAKYKSDLQHYGRELKAHNEWHSTYEGPYEFEMDSPTAREALVIEPERYFVSDSRLPNHGLPKGRKPGKWHEQQKQVRAEAARTRARELASDPVFGQEMTQ